MDLIMCFDDFERINWMTDTRRVSNISVPLGLNEIHDNNRVCRSSIVGCS